MFGLFKKSFESEMAEYSAEAKKLGKKYGLDNPHEFTMSLIFNPSLVQSYDQDMKNLFLKRIACCKKHGKRSDQMKWEGMLAQHNEMMG